MSDVKFDAETGRVASMGVEVVISAKERILLSFLMENVGQICSKDDLLNLVWPERVGWNDSTNLTQLVSKLRRSLRPTGIDASIVTCGRSGYKYIRSDHMAVAKTRKRGALIAILLVTVSSAIISFFFSEMLFDRSVGMCICVEKGGQVSYGNKVAPVTLPGDKAVRGRINDIFQR